MVVFQENLSRKVDLHAAPSPPKKDKSKVRATKVGLTPVSPA